MTMRPNPRSMKWGRTAWDMKNGPDRFTRITCSQSSGLIFTAERSCAAPALFTR